MPQDLREVQGECCSACKRSNRGWGWRSGLAQHEKHQRKSRKERGSWFAIRPLWLKSLTSVQPQQERDRTVPEREAESSRWMLREILEPWRCSEEAPPAKTPGRLSRKEEDAGGSWKRGEEGSKHRAPGRELWDGGGWCQQGPLPMKVTAGTQGRTFRRARAPLCCCHLEIPNNFQRSPTFSLWIGPHKIV